MRSQEAPDYDEVKSSYGCYIFATRRGAAFTPWYVGKTTKTFDKEIFTPHKIAKLHELRDIRKRGALYVFLISPERGRGAKNSSATDNMETYLVGACHPANRDLLNLRKLPKSAWGIVGVTASKVGAPTVGEQAVRGFVEG